MPDLPRQIRLAAGDYFMHGQDHRMRLAGLRGNICCVALRLDGGLNVELLRQLVESSPIMDWMARARIVRPLPLLPAFWRTMAKPRTIFHEHNDQNGGGNEPWLKLRVVAERELHAVRGPALALDLVRHGDGTSHLILSWNHTLLDARGVELILSHLGSGEAANKSPVIENFINPKQKTGSLAGWLRDVKLAHGSIKWLEESGREPLFTLLPEGSPAPTRHNHLRVLLFNAEETDRISARCQQIGGGFRRSHFYLAASIRALHNLAIRRGNRTAAYLVPVPHDTRRRGAGGPIFSNHLSILFYRLEPQQAGRMGDILGELGRQMTNQIRDRFPECCMAALSMFKPLPLNFYLRQIGKPTRGKFATFCFSDSGETCAGMTELAGGRILDVTHLVPTWRPPGLTVLFISFRGRVSTVLSWVDDCMSPAEVDGFERDLRLALLEEEVT
jgi:hypothetical protein